mmetsp:Transcript_120225/g.347449  ORF Transcript_120225/g.347449 Transcript_120225/m.347449 type:complete len:235 (+) Transcript_120225:107-811(+)|eukprot:CAMPEP_0176078394 /NCGR_PEP_ID=MMETSP0120_2-20121206/39203_1 /TAXON_ID=160619 /ORGANISM="Kryptoperidinium foliaceum, Strain CCMP 1326" /LENGTH=234 /DNA_ID=CAMNT_0017412139 /DNA_START=101 /DNA_END=805 /DNA_ORIENTATION=-
MVASIVEGLFQDASSWLLRLDAPAAWLVQQDDDLTGGIGVGDLEELQFSDSSTGAAVRVTAVDTISVPNRAKVEVVRTGEVMVVPVVDAEVSRRWTSGRPSAEVHDGEAVDAAQTTIYQDYEDAFELAEERTVGAEVLRVDGDEAAEEPATASAMKASDSGGDFVQRLSEGIQSEWEATIEDFRFLGEDILQLASGAKELLKGGAQPPQAQSPEAPSPPAQSPQAEAQNLAHDK